MLVAHSLVFVSYGLDCELAILIEAGVFEERAFNVVVVVDPEVATFGFGCACCGGVAPPASESYGVEYLPQLRMYRNELDLGVLADRALVGVLAHAVAAVEAVSTSTALSWLHVGCDDAEADCALGQGSESSMVTI